MGDPKKTCGETYSYCVRMSPALLLHPPSRLLQHLLPWCLAISFSVVPTHVTSPETSEMLHKTGSSARSARLQSKPNRTSCGLHPGIISYAFKREFPSRPLNYACVN